MSISELCSGGLGEYVHTVQVTGSLIFARKQLSSIQFDSSTGFIVHSKHRVLSEWATVVASDFNAHAQLLYKHVLWAGPTFKHFIRYRGICANRVHEDHWQQAVREEKNCYLDEYGYKGFSSGTKELYANYKWQKWFTCTCIMLFIASNTH